MPLSRTAPFVNFEYNLTRPLVGRHHLLDWGLLIFGILAIATLTTINAFLVGYDSVSVFTPDFNQTESRGRAWFQFWDDSGNKQICQPHQFHLGDRFRTNSSAFSYEIFGLNDASGGKGGEVWYANSPLDQCTTSNFQFEADIIERKIRLQAEVDCPPPLNIQARTSWSYTNHFEIGTLQPTAFEENTVPRAVLETLDVFGALNYLPIFSSQYTFNNEKLVRFLVIGRGVCQEGSDELCAQTRPDVAATFLNGIRYSDMSIAIDSRSDLSQLGVNMDVIYDMIEVFMSAVKLDFGIQDSANLFVNGTAFQTSLNQTYDLDVSTDFMAAASVNGAANLNATSDSDSILSADPGFIDLSYACTTQRRKAAGSFIASVGSSTVSVFLAVWGFVMLVVGDWARRHPNGNECGPHLSNVQILHGRNRSDEEFAVTGMQPSLSYHSEPFSYAKSMDDNGGTHHRADSSKSLIHHG